MKKIAILLIALMIVNIGFLSGCTDSDITQTNGDNPFKGEIFRQLYEECDRIINDKPFNELVTTYWNYDSDYYEVNIRDFDDFMNEILGWIEESESGDFYVINIMYEVELISDTSTEFFNAKARLENNDWVIKDHDDYSCSLKVFKKYWNPNVIFENPSELPLTITGCESDISPTFTLESNKTVEFDITYSCKSTLYKPNSVTLYSEDGVEEFIVSLSDYDYQFTETYEVTDSGLGLKLGAENYYLDIGSSCDDALPGKNYCWIVNIKYI